MRRSFHVIVADLDPFWKGGEWLVDNLWSACLDLSARDKKPTIRPLEGDAVGTLPLAQSATDGASGPFAATLSQRCVTPFA
jgi:hypothetical protein